MNRATIFLSVALAATPVSALRAGAVLSSGFQTGGQLLDACLGDEIGQLQCINYIEGASDMALTAQSVGTAPRVICQPVNATQGQVRDVVIAYLTRHPDHRGYLAASVVRVALAESFPCAPAI